MLKTIFRVFHEGDPKWEMLPTRNDHVGQLFFMLTAGTRRGEMDRFFSPDYTNATITVFYKNYDHETIKGAIERAKEYIADQHPARRTACAIGWPAACSASSRRRSKRWTGRTGSTCR